MFVKILIMLSFVLVTCLSVGVAGCDRAADKKPSTVTSSAVKPGEANSRDGWWCSEHGVPEEVCAQCNSKLVADFKAKGDWCAKHERPESQCFICHPDKEAEFAALYEAKFGTKPPKPEGDSKEEKPKS